jgi:glutaconyl-CoA/methylmalonyl-CoA decarboxylase subunit gamma
VKTYHIRVDGVEAVIVVEETARGVRLSAAGSTHHADLIEIVPGWFSLLIDGRSYTAWVLEAGGGQASSRQRPGTPAGPGRWMLILNGVAYAAEVEATNATGRSNPAASPRHGGEVKAPMPGLVIAVQASRDSDVTSGQPLIIMEAMKMQMEIRSPHAGHLREIHVTPGQEVTGGQLLATID